MSNTEGILFTFPLIFDHCKDGVLAPCEVIQKFLLLESAIRKRFACGIWQRGVWNL